MRKNIFSSILTWKNNIQILNPTKYLNTLGYSDTTREQNVKYAFRTFHLIHIYKHYSMLRQYYVVKAAQCAKFPLLSWGPNFVHDPSMLQ